ncbi:MAG: PPOX class F420-dependent oxidoreductase [Chloroflexia bacterium]
MAERMTPEERSAFLLEGARTGKLATTGRDGHPHVVPIWFVLDGDDLVFMLHRESAKGKNILRDLRVAICVDDERPPFDFVLVQGIAETSDDLEVMLDYATRIAERYMGADRADEYGRRNAVEGELLVRVTPSKVVAMKRISD